MPVVTTAEYVVMVPDLLYGPALFRPDPDTVLPVFQLRIRGHRRGRPGRLPPGACITGRQTSSVPLEGGRHRRAPLTWPSAWPTQGGRGDELGWSELGSRAAPPCRGPHRGWPGGHRRLRT